MITFGYAKKYYYTNDGTLMIQVRIPSIHGPYRQSDAQGKLIRNYVKDEDLPEYQSILLPHLPLDGEVVALMGTNSSMSDLVVIGLTGASYQSGRESL